MPSRTAGDRGVRVWALWAGAGLAVGLGTVRGPAAWADPDDGKERDRQPAVVAKPLLRGPDAWKTATEHVPVSGAPDAPFQMRNMTLRSWMPLNTFPGFSTATSPSGADVWGYTSPSGREYALMGLSWGIAVVEVTDPGAPVVVSVVPAPQVLYKDIDVIGGFAYAVSDSTGVGIQVIDLRQVDSGQVTLVRNYAQGAHRTTHTLIANPASGFLYLNGGNAASRGGLIAASTLADPTFPTFTGPGWTTQYVHESHIVSYTSGPYAGREIAFLFAAGPVYGSTYTRALSIVDFTNKAAPQQLSFIAYPGMRFCHQGWTSDDRKYLYINDELDAPGTTTGNVPRYLGRIFDVSDLSLPRLVSTYTNGLPAHDHNQYVRGRYMYQSMYTTGLRVFDLSNPLRPVEVAWIDTRPENDATTYNGNWGSYPFFNSGTILASDIERGLFAVELSLLEMSSPAPQPTALPPQQPQPVTVNVKPLKAAIQQLELLVSVNGGPAQAIPMAAVGAAGDYTASIPAQPCAARVGYSFRGTSTDGRTFTWPLQAAQGDVFRATAMTSPTTVFSDNFNANQGWTVQNTTVTSGAWVRAQPVASTNPGVPVGDADGSGWAFVTGNSATTDLQGGPTRLLSPALDLSAQPEARVSVSRWLVSLVGVTDSLVTEISNNNGATWTQVDSIGPVSGGWSELTFRVADFVPPSAQVRVRFSIADTDGSSTQAGVDAFRVWSPFCATTVPTCYANCDGSTSAPTLNALDFGCFLNRYVAGDAYANCDGSTNAPVLNALDFGCFLGRYQQGCP